MRAISFAQFGSPEVLEVIDAPVPEPGPGQIRVKVQGAGVNPVDWKFRSGMMGGDLPRRVGQEFAGTVDALGEGVSDVAVGDAVFGFAIGGAAADYTRSAHYARIPDGGDVLTFAGLPVAVETAVRCLDLVGVAAGTTLVVNGASGAVGQSVLQLARLRGAHVIGTASERNHPLVRELGAEPVTYGPGLADRVRALGVSPVDAAIDAAGGGALPDLVELTGGTESVVTIADFAGAEATGVTFSGGTGAYEALAQVAELVREGRFSLPVERTFPLEAVAEAQELSASGRMRGKIVLTV